MKLKFDEVGNDWCIVMEAPDDVPKEALEALVNALNAGLVAIDDGGRVTLID